MASLSSPQYGGYTTRAVRSGDRPHGVIVVIVVVVVVLVVVVAAAAEVVVVVVVVVVVLSIEYCVLSSE